MPSSAIQIVDGVPFIKLVRSCRQLHRLFGCNLTYNGFLDDLHRLRDQTCLDIIAKNSDRGTERVAKRTLSGPRTLDVMAPIYSDTVPPIMLTMMFEVNNKNIPTVKVTPASMAYLIDGSQATIGQGQRNRKRKIADIPSFSFDVIQWCSQRQSCFVRYRDGDGRERTRHCKPRLMIPDELEKAEGVLREFYVANHHGEDLPDSESEIPALEALPDSPHVAVVGA